MEFLDKTWPVQDAKARFSEMLEASVNHGPQLVTKHGTQTAVLVSMAEWQRMQDRARPTLKELLLSDAAPRDLLIPPRGRARRRVSREGE